jgi:hypothetical protein
VTETKKKAPEKVIRTRKRIDAPADGDMYQDKTLKLPEMDIELFGPSSYFTEPIGPATDGEGQEFAILMERLKGLTFDGIPGRALNKAKKLRVMKAIKPDGTIIQLPLEDQINNAVAGRPGDQIGLLTYTDKGYVLLQDPNKYPYYCYAVDCWAAAMRKAIEKKFPEHVEATGTGFCSEAHLGHTMPNRSAGMFGIDATTSRVYNG